MSDLEWLATHLGWEELFYERGDLWGVKPRESILHDGYSRVPRYDKFIDLMVELVKQLPREQRIAYCVALDDAVTDEEDWDQFDIINAHASMRLKAYRKVMEEANGTTQAPTKDGD